MFMNKSAVSRRKADDDSSATESSADDDERELSKAKASEGTKRKDGALVLRTTTDYVNKQITTTNAQKTKEGKNTDAIGQQQASSSFKEAINIIQNKLNYDRSLGLLSSENAMRRMCNTIANSLLFQQIVLVIVILNGVIIAIDTPDRAVELYGTKPNIPKDVTFWLGNTFLILFGLESIIKIVAYGFLFNGPSSYMWSYWNAFDLLIVVTGVIDVVLDGGGWITTLRLMKCFQPLKQLSKYKAGRMVMETAEKALPMMFDVVLLLLWFVILATVMGVMLFGTMMSGRNYEDVANLGGDPKEICDRLVFSYSPTGSRYDEGGVPGDEELCLNSNINSLVRNATLLDDIDSNVYCCESGVSPFDNYLNFDNFIRGMFIVLHIVTIDGWNELAWPVANTVGYIPAMAYFCCVAILGGFFVFQLFTAVICATLGEVEDEDADDDPEAHKKELEELRESHEKSLEVVEQFPQLEHSCAHKPRQMILDFTNHPFFQNFITFTIILNTGLMCANHVDKTDLFKEVETILDLTCSGIFLFEFFLKHIGLGIFRYWKDNWNKLDGFVVLVSIVDFTLTNLISSGGEGTPVDLSFLRVFRVFRILRTLKIVRNNAEFMKIANSAIAATSNMWVFLLVWLMFLVIFAILGVQLFAARESFDEERLSFKNFGAALITLFAVSTGENTFEVAWSSMRVTNVAAGIYMILWCFISEAVLALVLGILIDAIASETFLQEEGEFHAEGAKSIVDDIRSRVEKQNTLGKLVFEEEDSTDEDDDDRVTKRRSPPPASAMRNEYGEISLADSGFGGDDSRVQRSAQEVAVVRQWLVSIGFEKHTKESLLIQSHMRPGNVVRARKRLTCYRERRVKQAKEELRVARDHLNEKLSNTRMIPRCMSLRCNVMNSDDVWVDFDQAKMNPDFVKPIFMRAPVVTDSDQMRDVCDDNCKQIKRYLIIDPLSGWGNFRWECLKLATNFWFDNLILIMILASSVIMATNTQRWPVEGTKVFDTYEMIDIVFNAVFTFEMILKMIGYNVWKGPGAYLKSGFNKLDCFVVISSLLTYVVGDAIPVKTLRILRVLRPLRTIQRLPGLKLVITVIIRSIPSIKYVCIIGFGMMIVLGITGMELFLGEMSSCTRAGEEGYDKAKCLEEGGVWQSNRFNFDNIGQAMITIFIISTGDNWQDIMYVAMDSTGVDTAPVRDANKGAAAFYVFSILIAMMLWANLFVSALVDNFTSLASEGIQLTTEKQREWQQAMLIANRVHTNRWRKHVPKNPIRRKIHEIISMDWFDKLSITMIILNMFVLIAYRANGSAEENNFQEYAGYIFTVWYCCESLFLILGMGWKFYWESMWNKIDFVVAWSGGLGAVLPGLLPSNIIRMVRFFRLLKVIQVFKGLRTLVITAVSAIPGVINVSALSLLIIFIFACLGVSLFGNDTGPFDGNAITEYSNFSNFEKAFTSLFIAFSGNWQGFFNDLYVKDACFEIDKPEPGSEPKCDPDIASAVFFVLYIVLAVFLFGNLFVAILLERFSFAHGEEMEDEDDEEPEEENNINNKSDKSDNNVNKLEMTYESGNGPIQVIIASVRLRQILRMFSQKIKAKQELYSRSLQDVAFDQTPSGRKLLENPNLTSLTEIASVAPAKEAPKEMKNSYVATAKVSASILQEPNESYAEWRARKKKRQEQEQEQ